MKYRVLVPAIAACLSCSLGSAFSENEKDYKTTVTVSSSQPVNVSQVLHSRVLDRQGQKLGDVEDVIVDPGSGRIQFAVLKLEGDLADKGKFTPVPFSLLKLSDTDKKDMFGHRDLILQTDRDKLLTASRFNAREWPDTQHVAWGQDVYTHYGLAWIGDVQRGATGTTFESSAGTDRSVTIIETGPLPPPAPAPAPSQTVTVHQYDTHANARYSERPVDNGTGPDGKDTFHLWPRPWPYHDVSDAH